MVRLIVAGRPGSNAWNRWWPEAAPKFCVARRSCSRRPLTGSLTLVAVWLVRREGLPPKASWPGILASRVRWFGVYMVSAQSS